MRRSANGDDMKSSKTMRELAKALAIRRGVVEAGGYAGFALSMKDLRVIYSNEGFPVMQRGCKTLDNHIAMWETAHKALRVNNIVFFALDADDWMDDDPHDAIRAHIAQGQEGLVDICDVLDVGAII